MSRGAGCHDDQIARETPSQAMSNQVVLCYAILLDYGFLTSEVFFTGRCYRGLVFSVTIHVKQSDKKRYKVVLSADTSRRNKTILQHHPLLTNLRSCVSACETPPASLFAAVRVVCRDRHLPTTSPPTRADGFQGRTQPAELDQLP